MKLSFAGNFRILIVSCVFLLIVTVSYCLLHVDRWLVLDNQPVNAELIVVLGGGGAGRLRKGISLYDQGYAGQLLLIDQRASDWVGVFDLCKDCVLAGKNVLIVTGSTSTYTDAAKVKDYCIANHINSFLVVTDPYHTRRVYMTFSKEFWHSNILFKVINSGDQCFLAAPGKNWWEGEVTFNLVFWEATKCIYVILTNLNIMPALLTDSETD